MKRLTLTLCALATPLFAENRIDIIRPDAPELAAFGAAPIGVRQLQLTDPDRIDVIATQTEGTPPTAPRMLTIELWYPAADGTAEGGSYAALLRDGATEVTLEGRALRDAAPANGSFPLILLSHGYPGNRFLMSHLGENLASKGYVVAAIDHPDSTYDDLGPFPSTLVNRPVDQAFALEALATLDDPIGAVIDADRTGIIGYSMGGYGALIFAGGGLAQSAIDRREPAHFNAPQDLLARHLAGSTTHGALQDERLSAVVAIGPWGRNRDFWDANGLSAIDTPLMLVAGSVDDVSGYDAIRTIFEESTGTDRLLLTYENANHNAAAPIPAPAESYAVSEVLGWAPFEHYADPVWDSVRMNNVLAHFVTAFMDLHLKDAPERTEYLDVIPIAADGVFDMSDDGVAGPDHSYWPGFPNRTASGLRLERLDAGD